MGAALRAAPLRRAGLRGRCPPVIRSGRRPGHCLTIRLTSSHQTHQTREAPVTEAPQITAVMPQPLVTTVGADVLKLSVIPEHATRVDLLLFDRCDDPEPSRTIQLHPDRHRSFHFWHCHVRGLGAGQVYAYRMDGPHD